MSETPFCESKMASKCHLFVTFLVLSISVLDMAASSQDVMRKLTSGFAKVLEQCKSEVNVGDHIMQDFFNFWREEYELLNRDMGCVILCMASKLDLIDEDLRMHHGNAHEFAKSHGADDDMAKQLITMIHDCENTHSGISDSCSRVLEVSKCFRTKIHELKWAPSMEVILEEVMAAA